MEGPTGVGAFDEGGGRIVYALVSVPDPNELYVREKNGQVRQLTELNAWVKDKELVIPQERWITRPDGLKVQYWVMNPTHAEAGKRYPWVLEMHGGPERHVGSRRIQHVVGVPALLLLGLWRDLRQSARLRRLRLRIPEGQLPQLGQGSDGRRARRAGRLGEGRRHWSTRIASS